VGHRLYRDRGLRDRAGIIVVFGWRALILSRHANSVDTLISLFGEHRAARLADARYYVIHELPNLDLSKGLSALPADKAEMVRELAWFYDNLGALVAHGVVDIKPVSGYLGVSVVLAWEAMQPLIVAERAKRQKSIDPERWQLYFENLHLLVKKNPPAKARASSRLWFVE